MKPLTVLVLLLFYASRFTAQNDSIKKAKIDSLTLHLRADSLHLYRFNRFRPYANIDNRNSFITNRPVNIQGGQIGVVVNEYHIFGLGFYTIIQQSQKAQKTKDDTRTVNQYLSLNYYTAFYQYVLVDKRFFEIDLPFELGLGKYALKYENINTQHIYKTRSALMAPMGAGLQLVIKPFRWIGFSTTGGYRYVAEKNQNLNFNGLYYSFGLWLDIRQIYRDLKYYGVKRKKYKKAVQQVLLN